MSRFPAYLTALALAASPVLGLVSCGGGEDAKLLPGTTAQQITEHVAAVRDLVSEGECVSARDAAQEVGSQVGDLSGIDAKLKEALESGAEKLNEVVLTCTEEPEEEETEETVPAEETTKPGKEKPEKAKPGKEKVEPPAEEPTQEETPKSEQTPPKGEAKGHEPPPPATPEPPSGGIGPGSQAGAEG